MQSSQTRKKIIPRLYEDPDFIVFDKPAGLLTVPSPREEKRTLEAAVNAEDRRSANEAKLYPCHRLDKDTSGAILFARGKANRQAAAELFKAKKIRKKYTAIVQGRVKYKSGEITRPAANPLRFRGQKKKAGAGKKAKTRYRVLAVKKHFSVLEAEPVTGKTNQIRIHFAQEGHPIVGDRKYSIAKNYAVKFRRTALHAASLSWRHPATGKDINVQSPLPKDMEVFLARHGYKGKNT